jgi:hypothetical protein
VLRIVELLLVLTFVLVDDFLEDGLDAGIDLTWLLLISLMRGQDSSREQLGLATFAWTTDLCSSLIFGWE